MSILTGTFTATGQVSPLRTLTVGKRLLVSMHGTWTGAIRLCRDVGGTEETIYTFTSNERKEFVGLPDSGYHLHSAMVSTGTPGWRMEEGNATVSVGDGEWDDIRFPAQSINPIGAVSDPGVDTSESGFPGTLLFDASTVEMIAGVGQMSHEWDESTPLRPHVHWMKTTSAVGRVIWHLYYRVINRGVASEAWVGPVVGVDELSTLDTAHVEAIDTFGDMSLSNPGSSKMFAWRLYRKADDAADTYAADARLLEVDFHYRKNSIGTGLEFLK